MNFETYTERARGFVQSAQTGALAAGHQQFTPEHILKVLLDDSEGLAAGLIERAGGRARDALAATEQALAALPKVSGGGGQLYLAPPTAKVFDTAEKIAKKAGDSYVTVERLLLALAMEKAAGTAKILADAGVTPQSLNGAIEAIRKGRTADTASAENQYDALKKYTRDLTADARDGKLDPVIGRDEEIRRTIQVLARRTKNNPVLIGEPGVGKTAIAEGLSLRIVNGDVPESLKGKKLLGARHGCADCRRQISRRVRGAPEGRAQRDPGVGRRRDPVHRRDAYAGRRRQGGRRHGRLQPLEAGAGARRPALRRRHDARRIPQICREGRGPCPAFPAGLRRRADGRGHRLDPARPQGEVRAAPRRAHHRFGAGLGGLALQSLHRRPLPARQGDRPHGRGGLASQDAGRFQARGAGRTRPARHPAQDRARGAEEGDRPGLQGPARPAGEGARRSGRAVERAHPALDRRKGEVGLLDQGQGAARPGACRPRQGAAQRRPRQGRRACLWRRSPNWSGS